jgi:hypothetical protein
MGREKEGGGVLSTFICGGDDTAFPEHVYLWYNVHGGDDAAIL